MSNEDLQPYIDGIAKASFCKPKIEEQYVSLAHFLSLQPRECMKIKEEYYPDMMVYTSRKPISISGKTLVIWLPTPPKKNADQIKYSTECRKRMLEVASNSDFDNILLDVRGNIGGVLFTVLDAIYPILADQLNGTYLTGVDNKGKKVTTFEIQRETPTTAKHVLAPSGNRMVNDFIPIDTKIKDIFRGKPINVICNRFTMSTGEIICIIVRKIGGKVYGERTRGLTNGMEIISNSRVKSVNIPYYSIADGDKIYYNGVEPDIKCR